MAAAFPLGLGREWRLGWAVRLWFVALTCIGVAWALTQGLLADGLDEDAARERFKQKPDEFFIKPAAIADELWHVAHQDRSAWYFNVEVRPYAENW